jgi:hypothetical protein
MPRKKKGTERRGLLQESPWDLSLMKRDYFRSSRGSVYNARVRNPQLVRKRK